MMMKTSGRPALDQDVPMVPRDHVAADDAMRGPRMVWLDETSEDEDGFFVVEAERRHGNMDIPYLRMDIASPGKSSRGSLEDLIWAAREAMSRMASAGLSHDALSRAILAAEASTLLQTSESTPERT
jgi:hypothetical protein